MHDLSYFLDKNVFDDDGFQNMFVYQPTFNMLDLKTTRKKNKKKQWLYYWLEITIFV